MNLSMGGGFEFQLHPRPFETMLYAHGLKAQFSLKWASRPPTGVSSLLLWRSVRATATAAGGVAALVRVSGVLAAMLGRGVATVTSSASAPPASSMTSTASVVASIASVIV